MGGPENKISVSDALNIDLKEESQRKHIDRLHRMNVIMAATHLERNVAKIKSNIPNFNELYQVSPRVKVKLNDSSTYIEYKAPSSDTNPATAQIISYVQFAIPQITEEATQLRLRNIKGILGIPAHPNDPQIAEYFKTKKRQERPRTFLYVSEEGYMTKLFSWPDAVKLSRQYGDYPQTNLKLANPTQIDFQQMANILNLFSRELVIK